jgi:hypothetical protein
VDSSAAIVLKGFMELNSSQRQEVVNEINRLLRGTVQEGVLKEDVRKSVRGTTINFGPRPEGGCPCCGR